MISGHSLNRFSWFPNNRSPRSRESANGSNRTIEFGDSDPFWSNKRRASGVPDRHRPSISLGRGASVTRKLKLSNPLRRIHMWRPIHPSIIYVNSNNLFVCRIRCIQLVLSCTGTAYLFPNAIWWLVVIIASLHSSRRSSAISCRIKVK